MWISLPNCAFFSAKLPSITQRSVPVPRENAFKEQTPVSFIFPQNSNSNSSFTLIKNNFKFEDGEVWIQSNSTICPMAKYIQCSCDSLSNVRLMHFLCLPRITNRSICQCLSSCLPIAVQGNSIFLTFLSFLRIQSHQNTIIWLTSAVVLRLV